MKPGCEACEAEEVRVGDACNAREREARARGEKYECECEPVECTHSAEVAP